MATSLRAGTLQLKRSHASHAQGSEFHMPNCSLAQQVWKSFRKGFNKYFISSDVPVRTHPWLQPVIRSPQEKQAPGIWSAVWLLEGMHGQCPKCNQCSIHKHLAFLHLKGGLTLEQCACLFVPLCSCSRFCTPRQILPVLRKVKPQILLQTWSKGSWGHGASQHLLRAQGYSSPSCLFL